MLEKTRSRSLTRRGSKIRSKTHKVYGHSRGGQQAPSKQNNLVKKSEEEEEGTLDYTIRIVKEKGTSFVRFCSRLFGNEM